MYLLLVKIIENLIKKFPLNVSTNMCKVNYSEIDVKGICKF